MSDGSKIEWTDATWSPTTGCDRISDGCDHCYALTLAGRLKAMGQPKYQRDGDPRTSGPGFGVTVHPDTVNLPLRWRKPRRVFVNAMSDLFHAEVPEPWLAEIFAVMAAARRHTFQVLTKRHARMRSLLNRPSFPDQIRERAAGKGMDPADWAWPVPNVWLGVSVEDQKWAGIRIPALIQTPAAIRFLSCEPLLGPVGLFGHPDQGCEEAGPGISHYGYSMPVDYGTGTEWDCEHQHGIDWVIAGGESGPGARPVHPEWVRSLRDQCSAAEVPFFFKQWGAWRPLAGNECAQAGDEWPAGTHDAMCRRVGKKAAGRELDGRTWDEFPHPAAAGAPLRSQP